jgi:predicted RNase H-like HicB family nuclease
MKNVTRKKLNTLEKGAVRYIVFREEGDWYGVALEFNIVESGDDPREVVNLLFEAIEGYVESARKVKARPAILNQPAEAEYELLWKQLHDRPSPRASTIPVQSVYTYGSASLVPA